MHGGYGYYHHEIIFDRIRKWIAYRLENDELLFAVVAHFDIFPIYKWWNVVWFHFFGERSLSS